VSILKKARSCWRTGKWIQAPAQFASLLRFPIPVMFCVPASMDVCASKTNMKNGALLVPQSAFAQSQGKLSGGGCRSDHKVSVRTVKPGETVGTMWVIDEGLKPGEQVAVEGLQQLKEGTTVIPKPAHLSGKETKLCRSSSSTVRSWR